MISISVHRDLTRYRAKVVGGLTARSLACTAAALATGVAAYGWLTWALGFPFEQVSPLVYGATLPLWALGFLEPGGMRPERWLPLWLRQHFGRSRLTYENTSRLRAARHEFHERTGDDHGPTIDARQEPARVRSAEYERLCRRQRGLELWEPSRAR